MHYPIVLYYHHIATTPRPDHWFFRNACTFEQFHHEMSYLRTHYVPISVTEMADKWDRGLPFPRRAAVVTFDDGFHSNLEAGRVLHSLSIPACFFITVGTVDSDFVPSNLRFAHILTTRGTSIVTRAGRAYDLTHPIQRRQWYHATREELMSLPPADRAQRLDQLAEAMGSEPLPEGDADYRYLSSSDLHELRRLGMDVGCHGDTHDNLARCDRRELGAEMVQSKQRLEDILGEPVDFFAYPDGRYNRAARNVARKHYRLAFAIEAGDNPRQRWSYRRRGADGASLKRVMSWWHPARMSLARGVKRTLGMG